MTKSEVRQRFFSFRNGIVAKAFSDAGAPYKMIFGLQLPQLAEIAREIGKDETLAAELWADCDCRESRLLACRLFNAETLTINQAEQMAGEVQTREEADYLAFALLRYLPFAGELLKRLEKGNYPSDSMITYAATALRRNLD